ncbi:XRE family transcriptional regulator [Zwartia vadi]|uniref:XRE family transcriptional regulator n=1 Tax=Zwartia vadi TaxID=3058168 RepID=UPI0025B57E41|nr:LexA family transcriptional regulator [Zwartia vadi]MDN3986343.1 helix-turn-helix domain-containing protein [Zwartia vadi]
MTGKGRSPLTYQEIEDAKRLKKLWQDKKDELGLSQVRAAKELGFNSQSSISQYLNGKVALSFFAVSKFAKILRVNLREISPRFAHLAPDSLTGFVAPNTGQIGDVSTESVLTWFAMSENFCKDIKVSPENLKLIRIEDDSFKELASGSVVLVDDGEIEDPTDGVYLLLDNGKIIARRLIVIEQTILLCNGNEKKQQISKEVFGLLKVLARVIFVISPVI